jgi:hypothetical protein
MGCGWDGKNPHGPSVSAVLVKFEKKKKKKKKKT